MTRKPNALDRAQGQMELFINEMKPKISRTQHQSLKQIAIMQKGDILLVTGTAGTGKSSLALQTIAMLLKSGSNQRAIYCAPNFQVLDATI